MKRNQSPFHPQAPGDPFASISDGDRPEVQAHLPFVYPDLDLALSGLDGPVGDIAGKTGDPHLVDDVGLVPLQGGQEDRVVTDGLGGRALDDDRTACLVEQLRLDDEDRPARGPLG